MEFTLQASLPASDIDRAKAWYSDKLGAEPTTEHPGPGCCTTLEASSSAYTRQSSLARTRRRQPCSWSTTSTRH